MLKRQSNYGCSNVMCYEYILVYLYIQYCRMKNILTGNCHVVLKKTYIILIYTISKNPSVEICQERPEIGNHGIEGGEREIEAERDRRCRLY